MNINENLHDLPKPIDPQLMEFPDEFSSEDDNFIETYNKFSFSNSNERKLKLEKFKSNLNNLKTLNENMLLSKKYRLYKNLIIDFENFQSLYPALTGNQILLPIFQEWYKPYKKPNSYKLNLNTTFPQDLACFTPKASDICRSQKEGFSLGRKGETEIKNFISNDKYIVEEVLNCRKVIHKPNMCISSSTLQHLILTLIQQKTCFPVVVSQYYNENSQSLEKVVYVDKPYYKKTKHEIEEKQLKAAYKRFFFAKNVIPAQETVNEESLEKNYYYTRTQFADLKVLVRYQLEGILGDDLFGLKIKKSSDRHEFTKKERLKFWMYDVIRPSLNSKVGFTTEIGLFMFIQNPSQKGVLFLGRIENYKLTYIDHCKRKNFIKDSSEFEPHLQRLYFILKQLNDLPIGNYFINCDTDGNFVYKSLSEEELCNKAYDYDFDLVNFMVNGSGRIDNKNKSKKPVIERTAYRKDDVIEEGEL
ncbi:hypothetical protein HK099_002008 [Clydaea vesicula]|uniref:Uncharacterized protein n=1 Tax=Clydaea vesicula TaxID=447962 RepID=A0AAD5Y1L6_9FUNG|nr:hypothetical protein HK099_002008 [Clydaea vesicula]KAJ3392809.1 hypothetical protein HDU92_008165 [Lobulomyces angularis]